MNFSFARVRWRRVIGGAFAVMALSFLIPILTVTVYAFVLAFQARGTPNQTAIQHFASSISPKMMPWLETVLTAVFAFKVSRQAEEARIASGVMVGILAALLSTVVTLAFGGRMNLHNSLFFFVVVAIGCLGSWLGEMTVHGKHREGVD